MTDNTQFYNEFFEGLKALAETSFPKKCANCGRTFATAEQFLLETKNIKPSSSGLKQSEDDNGMKLIEVFRNCPCGSTLMDFFSDRRDMSAAGATRRKRFDELILFLEKNGLTRSIARSELIKVMRGEQSDILPKIHPPDKTI